MRYCYLGEMGQEHARCHKEAERPGGWDSDPTAESVSVAILPPVEAGERVGGR